MNQATSTRSVNGTQSSENKAYELKSSSVKEHSNCEKRYVVIQKRARSKRETRIRLLHQNQGDIKKSRKINSETQKKGKYIEEMKIRTTKMRKKYSSARAWNSLISNIINSGRKNRILHILIPQNFGVFQPLIE